MLVILGWLMIHQPTRSRFIVHFNGVGDKLSVREDGFTQIAGNVQVGDSGNSRHVRAYHNDGSYAALEGYGLIMNRAASYIRPTSNGDKTLYIGGADDSLDWADVIVRNDRGMHVHGSFLNRQLADLSRTWRLLEALPARLSYSYLDQGTPTTRWRLSNHHLRVQLKRSQRLSRIRHDWTGGWYLTGATHDGFATAEHVYLADNTTTNKQAIIIGSTSEGRSYLTVTVDVISAPHFYRNNMDFHAGVTMSAKDIANYWSLSSSRVRSSLRTKIGEKHYYEIGQYGRIYGGSSAYISLYSSAYLRIQGANGYADIGAGNSTYFHIQTDGSRYYSSKHLVVDEGIISVQRRLDPTTRSILYLSGGGNRRAYIVAQRHRVLR